jgi:hypothetical protein
MTGPLQGKALGAYTIVTYRPSDLHPDLSAAIDVVLSKRLSKIEEVEALQKIVRNAQVDIHDTAILGTLATNEGAVARKGSDGLVHRFRLLPRLTGHVRHREKYFDFDVGSGQEFVFTDNGQPIGSPARSLRQIAALIQGQAANLIGDHAGRGDFSRWISNVFHDYRLASEVRKIEQQYRLNHLDDVRRPIAALIIDEYKDTGN